MKIDKETIEEIANYLSLADSVRPIVKDAMEKVYSFGPEIYELMEKIVLGMADIRIASIKKYKDAGFSHEDALLMTCDYFWQMKSLSNRQAKKK